MSIIFIALIVSVMGIKAFSSDLLRCPMQLHQPLRRNFDRPADQVSPLLLWESRRKLDYQDSSHRLSRGSWKSLALMMHILQQQYSR
jgi:hypothetical protein